MIDVYIHNIIKTKAKAFKDDSPFVTLKIETQQGGANIYFETMEEVQNFIVATNQLLILAEETL